MKAREDKNNRGAFSTGGTRTFIAGGVVLLIVLLFAGVPLFLPMENEAERKRSAERQEIKAGVDAAQSVIMSRLDMQKAFENEAEHMMKSAEVPVREAAQKARPLPLAPEQS